MKVRTRSRLILIITIIIFLTVLTFISQSVILESFQNIEKREMTANVQRAVTNLDGQQKTLSALCGYWASQEKMYAVVSATRGNDHPRDQVAPPVSLEGYDIDYILMYNASGVLTYAERSGVQMGYDNTPVADLDGIIRNSILPEGFPIGISGRDGMSSLNGEAIILAGYPVVHANLSDPPQGTLVLVRTLGDERLQSLENILQVPTISLRPYTPSLMATITPEENERAKKGGIITHTVDNDRFEGITVITGIENKPNYLILSVGTARPIYQQVRTSILIFAGIIVLFSTIFFIAVQLLLQQFILRPISNLDKEMKLIGGDSSIGHRVDESGDEEIASLKKSLNRMLDEIQHYQEELRDSQNTLEERNQQLTELNRKANLYLDIYLDVITYEILNALMGLRGYADLIRTVAIGEEAEFAQKIEAIAKKSSDVIRNIETISRIYKNPPVNRPIDLGYTLRNEAQIWSNTNIGINTCNVKVMANEMLGVVFHNLFSNSVKYGGRTVQIDVNCHDKGDGFVEITVKDNGPGISEGMKKKVFDRFVSDSKTRGSYGLGLHIVKMLVEGYGGKVCADDRIPGEPDKGVVIRLTLRFAEEHSAGQGNDNPVQS